MQSEGPPESVVELFLKSLPRLLCRIGLHMWDSNDAAQVCLVCHVRGTFAAELSQPMLVADTQTPQSLDGWKDLCLPPLPEQVLHMQPVPEEAQKQGEVSKTSKAKSASA